VNLLRADPQLRTKEASTRLPREKYSLGNTQFKEVWRDARRQLGLSAHALAGRPKKSSGK
jgi:hypothetical protein